MKKRMAGVIAASAVVVVAIGTGIVADQVVQGRIESRIAVNMACALNTSPSKVTVDVKGSPILLQVAKHQLDDVSIATSSSGRATTMHLKDVAVSGQHLTARSATAEVAIPWTDLVKKAKTGSNASSTTSGASLLSLTGFGTDVTAETVAAGRQVSIGFRLGHTSHAVTLTPSSVGLGAIEIPISALDTNSHPQLAALATVRTVSPDLPAGASITKTWASDAGLNLDLTLNTTTLQGANGTSTDGSGTAGTCAAS